VVAEEAVAINLAVEEQGVTEKFKLQVLLTQHLL
jgi:hypothetical protein